MSTHLASNNITIVYNVKARRRFSPGLFFASPNPLQRSGLKKTTQGRAGFRPCVDVSGLQIRQNTPDNPYTQLHRQYKTYPYLNRLITASCFDSLQPNQDC